jgi:hypothetical protein
VVGGRRGSRWPGPVEEAAGVVLEEEEDGDSG